MIITGKKKPEYVIVLTKKERNNKTVRNELTVINVVLLFLANVLTKKTTIIISKYCAYMPIIPKYLNPPANILLTVN